MKDGKILEEQDYLDAPKFHKQLEHVVYNPKSLL